MPDGIDLKRIIDLDPETTVTDDDYTIVDSTTGGAKKFAIGQALGEIKDGLTAVQEGKLPFFVVKNEYIDNNGNFVKYNGWDRTELIPVSKYYSITVKTSVQSSYNAFYKADKTRLGGLTVTTANQTIVIPDNAEYVAFSNTASGIENLSASFITKEEVKITELRENYQQIKENLYNGVTAVDLLSFPYQLGVIYSTTADKTTNTIAEIGSADNRVVIGPIKFRKSVQVLNGENVQFKLYERYTSDTSSAFRDMYSTWKTSNAIIGVNSWSADNITYYIQVAYTDNRKVTNIAALVSDLVVVETDNNPLGLIETGGLLSGKAVPNGVGTSGSLRLVTGKITTNKQTRIATINSDYRVADSKGVDVYTECSTDTLSYGARKLDADNEHVLMIQKYPSGTQETLEFKNFQSFDDLYSAIGITVSDMAFNNTYITGNQLTDPTSLISATSYGNTIRQSIFSDGIMLDDDGAILYAHVPSMVLADGYAYIAFMANRVEGSEWSAHSEIDLAIVDLSDKSAEYIVIAKSGQYGGITFDGRCSYPAMCLKDNKLYVYFSGTVDGEQKLCCAVYDIELKTFSTSVCSIQYGGTTYEFSNSNFTRYIGSTVGLISLGYEIGICNPTTDGTNWYTALASGSAGQMRVPILKSTNMTTWDVFDILPYECGADCECAIRYSNGILYGASRHPYDDCTTCVFAYNIANKKVADRMQVPGSASRPTLFENGSGIALCLPQSGRRTMSLIQLSTLHIKESRLGASMTSYNSLSYNSIVSDSSKSYFAIQTYQRSGSSADVKANPAVFFGSCDKLVL